MPTDLTLPPDVVELFESGASLTIATRDARNRPECARACGAVVNTNGKTPRITVLVAESLAERTVANLRANGRIAVGFSAVFTHRSFQTKGTTVSIEPAAEIHRDVVNRYSAAWAEVLYMTGIPRAVTRQCATWPAVAITFDVEEMFLQTPGPKAGTAWKEGAER